MASVFDNEKRRFRRFPSDVLIKFRKLDLGNSHKEEAVVKAITSKASEISEVGLFISTEHMFAPNTVLEITFLFENKNHTVKSLARCVWCSEDSDNRGMGVEIFKVPEEFYVNIVLRAKRSNWIDAEGNSEGSESDNKEKKKAGDFYES